MNPRKKNENTYVYSKFGTYCIRFDSIHFLLETKKLLSRIWMTGFKIAIFQSVAQSPSFSSSSFSSFSPPSPSPPSPSPLLLLLPPLRLPRFVSWSQGQPPKGPISNKVGNDLSNYTTWKEKKCRITLDYIISWRGLARLIKTNKVILYFYNFVLRINTLYENYSCYVREKYLRILKV